MDRKYNQDIPANRDQLKAAQAELHELQEQIRVFEALVDERLGSLLDQLSELRAETTRLDETLRGIRERRLFGEELITYLEGAPKPARQGKLADLPPVDLSKPGTTDKSPKSTSASQDAYLPDIRMLYRRLARRYHPDLARSDADRVDCNEQMAEINRAYGAGDLHRLLQLAGLEIPIWISVEKLQGQAARVKNTPLSEQEEFEQELRTARTEHARLSSLPVVKLSLDVKLARHQHRDLLREIAVELRYKVAKKMAERDYLNSQIKASEGKG